MNNKQETILYRTNQVWKHYTSLAINIIAISTFAGSIYYFPINSWQFGLGIEIAAILAVVSLVIALNIKCPKCGSRWFWLALKAPYASKGIEKFLSQNMCPTCGYSNDTGT